MANSASSPTRDGDFYDVLGLQPSASAAEVRAAYRRAALEAHPDRPGGDGAQFRSLGRAYAVLSDGARRAEYDARRGRGGGLGGIGVGGSNGSGDVSDSFFAEDGVVEVDLASLGVVDAALLSVFGRLGVAIRAAPPPAVLEAARTGRIPESAAELSWANGEGAAGVGGGDGKDPLLRPLSPTAKNMRLPPPCAVAGSVSRGQADWYRITLPPMEKARGEQQQQQQQQQQPSYAIAAHSRAGSKLKLLLFEPGGGEGGGAAEGGGGGGVWELAASADSVPFVSASSTSASASAAAERASCGGSGSRPQSAAAAASEAPPPPPQTTNGQLALLVASDSFPTLEMKPAGTGASLAAAAAAAASSKSGGGDTPSSSSSADAHVCGGVFRRLDGLSSREPVPPADPGTELLIAVVGANTFRKSSYSLRAVLLPPSGGEESRGGSGGGRETSDDDDGGGDDDGKGDDNVNNARKASAAAADDHRGALLALRSTEEALLAQRRELSDLEGRHRAARAALDAVAAEAAAAGARVEALLRTRDEAYARVLCLNPISYDSSSSALFTVRSSSAGGEL